MQDTTKRFSGRTTRLADNYITELFTKGIIHVQDHHDTKFAHNLLFDKIIRRLDIEHGGISRYGIDREHLTIFIKRKSKA